MRTDGTQAGTIQVAAMRSSWPALCNGKVYFNGDHPSYGKVPMVFDPGATSRSLGSGVGEGTRVPALRASDPVLGSATTVDLQGGAAGSLIVLQVSFGAAQPSRIAPNAWLYSGPYPAPLYVQPMSGADWQATIPVPNDPLLQGLDVQLQAGLLGTGSSAPFELTNGVHAVLGS